MSKKAINTCVVIFIVAMIVVLLGLCFYWVYSNYSLYDFFNNQSVAISIGAILVFSSYLTWKWQHMHTLSDKYFSEYLDRVFRYLAIKEEEICLRENIAKLRVVDPPEKGKAWRSLFDDINELSIQEGRNDGEKLARKFLLSELSDYRWDKIESVFKDFSRKFKEFSKLDKDELLSKVDQIEGGLDSAEKKILSISGL